MKSYQRDACLLLSLMGALTFSGCKSEVCSSDNIDETRPTRDVSCPTGKVCYGGECISACNAGSERFVSCEDASACKSPARPFCVNNFCTACEQSTYCVPSLNICAPVKLPDENGTIPPDNEIPAANEPLDAGPIDGAMFSTDTGITPVIDLSPTHVASVDIVQITSYAQGQVVESAEVNIESRNVESASYVESATVAQPVIANSYRCDLQTIAKYVGTSSPADIGEFAFGNGMVASGLLGQDPNYLATFGGGEYLLSQPVPTRLLNYSTIEPPQLSYILFAATGNSELGISSFPAGPDTLLHVPYQLQPGANSNENIDTAQDLRNGYQVNRQAPSKMVFLWEFARNVVGVRIQVRIVGTNHELRCVGADQFERIEIVSRLLTQFANAEGIGPGTSVPIYVERIYGRQLDVPIEMDKDTLVDFSVQVRHSHQSTVRYE